MKLSYEDGCAEHEAGGSRRSNKSPTLAPLRPEARGLDHAPVMQREPNLLGAGDLSLARLSVARLPHSKNFGATYQPIPRISRGVGRCFAAGFAGSAR